MLLLQEFEFEIQHRSGAQHVVVDYRSAIENGKNVAQGDDNFPDSGIIRISTSKAATDSSSPEDKWLEKMSYFLTTGLLPPRMRTDEKKRLVVCIRNFCLVEATLYHKGSDNIW